VLTALARALAIGGFAAALLPLGATAQGAPFCSGGQTPTFQAGFASLSQQLGERMGDPVECEHPDADTGDTLQRTTGGLAFYRKSTNTPSFTNGTDHWAMLPKGLGHWVGSSIDPPQTTLDDARYFAQILPTLQHELDTFQSMQDADVTGDVAAVRSAVQGWRSDLAASNDSLSSVQPGPNTGDVHRLLLETNTLILGGLDDIDQAIASGDPTQVTALEPKFRSIEDRINSLSNELRADMVVLAP
jgi:hypothetical protein